MADNTFPESGNVGIGVVGPVSDLHVVSEETNWDEEQEIVLLFDQLNPTIGF